MKAQANLYQIETGEKITTRSMGKLVSNYLYSRKMFPLLTNLVIAGVDKDGPKLYSLDALGSLMPEDFATAGTGMLMSISILEAEYKPGMTVAEGEKLVEKAIRNSITRDAMTGNGIDILTITSKGSTEKFIEISELGE
jgi:proteasome beta subunit